MHDVFEDLEVRVNLESHLNKPSLPALETILKIFEPSLIDRYVNAANTYILTLEDEESKLLSPFYLEG